MDSNFKKKVSYCLVFFLVSFAFICCTAKKQGNKETIKFLDIPISGDILDFANQLEQRGFTKDADFNGILNSRLYGIYDGCPCTLVIGHSMKGEVISIYIKFHQTFEIEQKEEGSKEAFVNLDNVDSLKEAFRQHIECVEKTYSIILEQPEEEKNDTTIVIPYGRSQWLGSGFISIYPRGLTNVSIYVQFRGSGDDTAINEKEIEETSQL